MMKSKSIQIIILAIFIITPWMGCEKENFLETDPKKIILGKWELLERGNYPGLEPVKRKTGYREYVPDSTLIEYHYETQEYSYSKYWLDSLLHEGIPHSEGMFTLEFVYMFEDSNNKMLLDFSDDYLALTNRFVFKRVK